MNRRGFFSLMAGAAGAVLVPWRGIVDPVIVLPPAAGWFPTDLRMREIIQYDIADDVFLMRHDVLLSLMGKTEQFNVLSRVDPLDPTDGFMDAKFDEQILEWHRQMARGMVEDICREQHRTPLPMTLPLPNVPFAKYVS